MANLQVCPAKSKNTPSFTTSGSSHDLARGDYKLKACERDFKCRDECLIIATAAGVLIGLHLDPV